MAAFLLYRAYKAITSRLAKYQDNELCSTAEQKHEAEGGFKLGILECLAEYKLNTPDIGALSVSSLALTATSDDGLPKYQLADLDIGDSLKCSLSKTTRFDFLSNEDSGVGEHDVVRSLAHYQVGKPAAASPFKQSLASNENFEFLSGGLCSDLSGLKHKGEEQKAHIEPKSAKGFSTRTIRRVPGSLSLRNHYQRVSNEWGDDDHVQAFAWKLRSEGQASNVSTTTTIHEPECAANIPEEEDFAELFGHGCDSLEHASQGGGSPGEKENDALFGLDACLEAGSRPEEASNSALEQPIKRSRFAEFFKDLKPNGDLSMDMTTRRISLGVSILAPSHRYRSTPDRVLQYEDARSQAFTHTCEKSSATECDPNYIESQQHGKTLVPRTQSMVIATLQHALQQRQENEDRSLAHNFVKGEIKQECANIECRRPTDAVGNGLCADCVSFFQQDCGNVTDSDRTMIDDSSVDQEPDAAELRMRFLVRTILQGEHLEDISGAEAYCLYTYFPERVRMQVHTPRLNQETCEEEWSEEPQTVIHLSNSSVHAEDLDQESEAGVDWRSRIREYDAPWLVGDRTILSEICPVPFSLQPPTNSATPEVSEDGSNTDFEALDESIRYSPSIKEYRKAQLHHENVPEKTKSSTSFTSQSHISRKGFQSLIEIMKQRTSRQERMGRSQLHTQTHTSIFELAKTAQARVRGIEDPFMVSKKQRQYIDVTAVEEYESSSPSDLSDAEGWLSDLTDDARDAKEEECKGRAAHRAAALAMLEGRAQPNEDLQPIFRSARTEYGDHVEAEHGTLHTYAPKPTRPATQIQHAIRNWEEQIVQHNFQPVDPRPIGLGVTIPVQAAASDVLDWLNSDSPVDLLHGRPVFYQQPNQQADEFWSEMSLDQLNAENALPQVW